MAIEHPDHQDINSLGELPRLMRENRREAYGRDPAPLGPPGIIGDIPGSPRPQPPLAPLIPSPRDVRGQNQALIDSETTPYGLPSTDYLVQTVYDARPINANDFQFYDILALDPNGDIGAPIITRTVSFRVPEGRVGVLRRLDWFANDLLATPTIDVGTNLNTISPIFISLAVNGFVQTTYDRIYQQEGTREVYVIGFERETFDITITINPSFSGGIAGYSPSWFIQLHGNLLDTRGREKQYEPANEYRAGILK